MELYEKILKEVHSVVTNTRKKLKLTVFQSEEVTPTKQWFVKRSINSISIQDFIDILFKEASEKQRLNYKEQTISFDEVDANDLSVEANKEIHILEFFKLIPDILNIV